MKTPYHAFSIQDGRVFRDGQQFLLVSADYPYYRDDRANWADRLQTLKSLGIQVVTAYIPWRHHQLSPTQAPDFVGQTQPNRDVLGFLALCASLELPVIMKPGPFVHAELNYGGLPDWTCPVNNPEIEPLLNAYGSSVYWTGAALDNSGTQVAPWPLPAPFSPAFSHLVHTWMAQVSEQVIRPHEAPDGPIIALQIANEGIYSNGQHAPWAYDYSPSALALYREFLQARYQTLDHYNQQNATQFTAWEHIPAPQDGHSQHRQPYIDWGEFQADYMRQIFLHWSARLQTRLPIFINQNPPLGEPFGTDSWLTRVEPERWNNVHYGFTNWVGDVSANPATFDRYILTAKRTPGVNLEENWGFGELYDAAYVDAATSFYQTLAILNAGATGFNVYTGVATAGRDPNLEIIPRMPYPDAAPVTEHGEITPKAEIVRWLTTFMARYGAEFLACQPVQPAAWGVYLPAARWGAWDWESGGTHGQQLARFQWQMRQMHLDYGVLNLQATTVQDWLRFPYLMTACDRTMHRAVQEKLVEYARSGGRLALVGSLPDLDEHFHPCDILAANAGLFQVFPEVALEGWLAGVERPQVKTGAVDVWVRTHPAQDVQFVTLLFPTGSPQTACLTVPVGERHLRFVLSAAPAGGAFLRLEHGQISALMIKGLNHFRRALVAPRITLRDQEFASTEPGDFAWIDGRTYFLSAAGQSIEP